MSHPRGTFYVPNSILSPWLFDGKWHKKGESEGITTPPHLDGDHCCKEHGFLVSSASPARCGDRQTSPEAGSAPVMVDDDSRLRPRSSSWVCPIAIRVEYGGCFRDGGPNRGVPSPERSTSCASGAPVAP